MFSRKEILQILCIFAYCFTNSLSLKIPKKQWNYEFVSIGANSSDEAKLKIDIYLNRIERGVYTLSGLVDIKNDLKKNDVFMIEILGYRSATGSADYKITPFAVKKMDFSDFVDTFYKDIAMNSLHNCSNAPFFKSKFPRPLTKATYKLNNCSISSEAFPSYVPEGYYKYIAVGSGVMSFVIEVLTKVTHV